MDLQAQEQERYGWWMMQVWWTLKPIDISQGGGEFLVMVRKTEAWRPSDNPREQVENA